jgi:hypothetical protein
MTKEIQYKNFNGDARVQIPALLKAGYKPSTVADVMDLRMQGDLKDTYFDTIDAVAYNTLGDAKIIRNSKDLTNLTQSSKIRDGTLVLRDSEFESLTGEDVLYLTKKEKRKLHNQLYTQESVKDSKEWNFLARENSRLAKYADTIFPEMEKRFDFKKGMGLYFDSPSNFNKLRALYLYGVKDCSDASAWYDLDNDGNQFVGISLGEANKIL